MHTKEKKHRIPPVWRSCVLALQVSIFLILRVLALQNTSGEAIYRSQCATCHENFLETRALPPPLLRLRTRGQILAALESGRMKDQGAKLTPAERRTVADYLSTGTRKPKTKYGTTPAKASPDK